MMAPRAGSTTSPAALTATSAPTVTPSASFMLAEPRPLLVARSNPNILPTVAPVPAPTQPCGTGAADAASQAASPAAASGRTSGRPTGRSKSTAAGTIGTRSGADLHAAAVRLQPAHHAARGVQAEGAAAADQDGVHALHRVDGVEQVGLPRARRRAAHLDAGDGALPVAQHHGAAGGGLEVGPVADGRGRRRRSGSRSCVLLRSLW